MIGTPYLWPSACLDPGGLQHRLVLGAVVPPKLPEDEGEHLGQQQVGLGIVLGVLDMAACCSGFLESTRLISLLKGKFLTRGDRGWSFEQLRSWDLTGGGARF